MDSRPARERYINFVLNKEEIYERFRLRRDG